MTTTYFEQAAELMGWNALALQGMRQWAHANRKIPQAMQEASAAWHRNARLFSLSWDLDDRPDLSADEQLSIIAIAGVNKFDRPQLLKEWRDRTMGYHEVLDKVAAFRGKPRTPKVKPEPQAVTDARQLLIEVVAYDSGDNYEALVRKCQRWLKDNPQ